MFRLATALDLVDLKENPGDILPENLGYEYRWGLKNFGYMLALKEVQRLAQHMRPVVLEIGPGLGDMLFRRIADIADYIGIDKKGFYNPVDFDAAMMRRKPAKFVDGLMGEFLSDELPDNSVDLTCSVSVIEHVPLNNIGDVIADCARVTKPGGIFVHTLDVIRKQGNIWNAYREAITRHGFIFREPPMDIDFNQDGLLFETLGTLYRLYQKYPKGKQRVLGHNLATICIVATKKLEHADGVDNKALESRTA